MDDQGGHMHTCGDLEETIVKFYEGLPSAQTRIWYDMVVPWYPQHDDELLVNACTIQEWTQGGDVYLVWRKKYHMDLMV